VDWKDGLTQGQICKTLMSNGQALAFLEKLMEYSTKQDHLVAIGRKAYMDHAPELEPSFAESIGTALVLETYLRASDKVVVYQKREVGSLIRFESGTAGTIDGMALVDYLVKVPAMMNLNNAQIVELEFLLNKAGVTLGIDLPDVRPATEEEKLAALTELELPLTSIQAKPRASHAKFMDMMKAKGIPVSMTPKEFAAFVNSHL
jgi:hypothetical protein